MRSYTLRLRTARILELLRKGFNFSQVSEILDASPASVRYHANKLAKTDYFSPPQTPTGRVSWKGSCRNRKTNGQGTLSPMQKELITELINQNEGISAIALKTWGKDSRKARKSINHLVQQSLETKTQVNS